VDPLVEVSPTATRPTHHLAFKRRDGRKIGLVLCDGEGRPLKRSINRTPLDTTSLKIYEGNSTYGDFELPFTPIAQSDWSGGRAQEWIERDLTKYLDGQGVDTTRPNRMILGPLAHYTTGYRLGERNWPGHVTWQKLIPGGSRAYLARKLTPSTAYLNETVELLIRQRAASHGALPVKIRGGTTTAPTFDLWSGTIPLTATDGELSRRYQVWTGINAAGTNYARNPLFASNVTDDWTYSQGGTGGSVAQSTTKWFYGVRSAEITASSSGYSVIRTTNGVSVPNGSTVTISAFVYCGSDPSGNKVNISVFDSTNTQTRTTVYLAVASQWARMTASWTNTTGSAAICHLTVANLFNDSATKIYVSGAQIELASSASPMIAGGLGTGYAWTGTGNNSTSTRAANSAFPMPYPSTDGAVWVEVSAPANDNDDAHWQVGVKSTGGNTYQSTNGTTWTAAGIDLYHSAMDILQAWSTIYYQYRGAQYRITQEASGAPRVWINGDRGAADSNSGALTTLVDGTKTWVVNQWAGAVAVVVGGTGALEPEPWRTVVSNTATALTVDTAWLITHDTTTEYVIVAANSWRELTGHGLTGPVTSLQVVNGIVYMAQGEAIYVRRHREYNSAGTWTETDWAVEGTSYATFLQVVDDATNGKQIWRALQTGKLISRATATSTWGTALTFGTGIVCGDTDEKFTGLEEYVDPDNDLPILYVHKEGSVWAIKSDKPQKMRVPEMAAVSAPENGRAHLAHNVYLYFSLLNGIEQYFGTTLADKGPNLDRGLPPGRAGPVVKMAGYPGRYFAAVDAGAAGQSSVLTAPATGFHEIATFVAGKRPGGLMVQVIPGTTLNRLWYSEGMDACWLSLGTQLDPLQDAAYEYTWEGYCMTSRMAAGMQDLYKLYSTVKLITENLAEDSVWVEIDYKLDNETSAWQTISDKTFTVSPSQENEIDTWGGVVGKWMMLRIRLNTSNNLITPKVISMVVEAVSRVKTRFGSGLTVRLVDGDKDFRGNIETMTKDQKLALLDEFADSLDPLEIECVMSPWHGLKVFIDSPRLSPLFDSEKEGIEGLVATIPITQIRARSLVEAA
jgi:hypothetical protein